MCHNTVGGFSCSCREGFVFGSDGVTCECKNKGKRDISCVLCDEAQSIIT